MGAAHFRTPEGQEHADFDGGTIRTGEDGRPIVTLAEQTPTPTPTTPPPTETSDEQPDEQPSEPPPTEPSDEQPDEQPSEPPAEGGEVRPIEIDDEGVAQTLEEDAPPADQQTVTPPADQQPTAATPSPSITPPPDPASTIVVGEHSYTMGDDGLWHAEGTDQAFNNEGIMVMVSQGGEIRPPETRTPRVGDTIEVGGHTYTRGDDDQWTAEGQQPLSDAGVNRIVASEGGSITPGPTSMVEGATYTVGDDTFVRDSEGRWTNVREGGDQDALSDGDIEALMTTAAVQTGPPEPDEEEESSSGRRDSGSDADDEDEPSEREQRREEVWSQNPIHAAEESVERTQARVTELQSQITDLSNDKTILETRIGELEGLDSRTPEQETELVEARERLETTTGELEDAQLQLDPARQAVTDAEDRLRQERLSGFYGAVNDAGGWLKFILGGGEGQQFANTVSRWAGYDMDNPACPTCVQFFAGWGYEAWADAACRSNLVTSEGTTFISRSGYTSIDIEGERKVIYPCGSATTGEVEIANGSVRNCYPYYEYKITGGAVPAEVAMEFIVYLNSEYGSSNEYEEGVDLTLYVDEDNETLSVKLNRSGTPWALSGSNMFVYTNYIKFESVCMGFTEGSFDDLQMIMSGFYGSGLLRDDDNPLCNTIKDAYVSQSLTDEDADDTFDWYDFDSSGGAVITPESGCVGPSC